MAKRLTETNKWEDPWYFALTPIDKVFWNYMCDRCNHAGIWNVNIPLAKVHTGFEIQGNPAVFGDRIQILSTDKWLIRKFVKFQQGTELKKLNPQNGFHRSILKALKDSGLKITGNQKDALKKRYKKKRFLNT